MAPRPTKMTAEDFDACILLLLSRVARKKKRNRNCYIAPFFARRASTQMDLLNDLELSSSLHFQYFRMSMSSLECILLRIGNKIHHADTHAYPICPKIRLALTIRYLAAGESHASLQFQFRISRTAVLNIIKEVLAAIISELKDYLAIPDADSWKRAASGYESKWNFSNCVGSIDGKHVRVKAPASSGSQFYNFKGYFSIILMAVVGPRKEFLLVTYGCSGSNSDAGIFLRSDIRDLFENDKLDLPAPRYLEDGSKLSPVIIGDDAFPLNRYMLKPYPGKNLTLPERIFNYRLSRARMCVENAFGILAARWRIFQKPIECTNIKLPKLVTGASVTLHNFLLERKDLSDITPDRITRDGVVVPGSWRSVSNVFANMDQIGMDCTGERTRNAYTQYFNSPEGEVAWQKRYVLSTSIDTEMMEVV